MLEAIYKVRTITVQTPQNFGLFESNNPFDSVLYVWEVRYIKLGM